MQICFKLFFNSSLNGNSVKTKVGSKTNQIAANVNWQKEKKRRWNSDCQGKVLLHTGRVLFINVDGIKDR